MNTNKVNAVYRETGITAYKGNPFIEALPPFQDPYNETLNLRSQIKFDANDLNASRSVRAHNISRILDDFFQPFSAHMQLSERVSLMIRGGYVGRNPKLGQWQQHLQNGYERVQKGDLSAFRFESVKSTAQSMLLIGCSGGGKTTSLRRILASFPQHIYHPDLNIEQVVYLKIDCSHNGSLKEICLNFFRALDRAIGSNYEKQYGLKRKNSIETMLALMSQTANLHAIGLLVIDEIQHLNRSKSSGGSQDMLNFFVTLVNTIGIPVMLVGTPKARTIFEADLRSARRGAGLGAIFWDPLPLFRNGVKNEEWIAFTNNLWKLQLLQSRDLVLTETIRDAWYDLSQGVIDIVVKLFVLAQLRALAIGHETITEGLLRQVYKDELKPVHQMLDALRSGIPEKIAQYSDLMIPEIDRRLIQLQQSISDIKEPTKEEQALAELESDDERRIYLMLKDDFDSNLLIKIIQNAFKQNPKLKRPQLLPIVFEWLNKSTTNSNEYTNRNSQASVYKSKIIKMSDWNKLDGDDLRFLHIENKNIDNMHEKLERSGMLLNLSDFLTRAA